MRVALAQINSLVGAVEANERRILAAIEEARRQRADVVVFPEGALTGYPCRDLLYEEELVHRATDAAQRLARAAAIPAIVGSVEPAVARGPGGRPRRRNVALLLHEGRIVSRAKSLLPTYDVFDEARWFVPAAANAPVVLNGVPAGLVVCEDLWDDGYDRKPARDLAAAGARTLFALNASPFRVGVREERLLRARRPGVPVVYVNAVGGQDELVFDGGSFVVGADGALLAELPSFEEAVVTVDLAAPSPRPSPLRGEGAKEAITLGIRDFVRKNGLRDVWLGLSGGVDSALVACLARDALGPARVHALALPSRWNDPRSTEEARSLARALGIEFAVVPIEPLHEATEKMLGPLLDGTAGENVQARLRMLVLMAHVNARGGVLLNTSNKTELALGYGTLHGDLAGTVAPIGDLSKAQVYALARGYPEIPRFILDRAPSAELAPGQVDPFDYDVISPLADDLVAGVSREELLRRHPEAEVERCERLLQAGEHKRRQGPIVFKVSRVAFGQGRQVPVTHRFGADVSRPAASATT